MFTTADKSPLSLAPSPSTLTPVLRERAKSSSSSTAPPMNAPPGFDLAHVPAATPSIQRKPSISSPGDAFEREADSVADRVMRMAEPAAIAQGPPAIQRKCAKCEDDDKKKLHAKRSNAFDQATAPDTDAAVQATRQGGAPLSHAARAFFEPRFGHDFSQVRVHADGEAAQAARSVQARAYTLGRDIVFGSGQYAPSTRSGKHLLAHELTHVVQQAGGAAAGVQRAPPAPSTKAGSDFDIVGKPEQSARETTRIHFDKDSDVIDSDEDKKLAAFKTVEVTLDAHQSEEEPAGTAGKRAAAVKAALVALGHAASTLHVNIVGVDSQMDYAGARIVEIVRAGTTAKKSTCPTKPKLSDMAVACATVGRSAPFHAALKSARGAIKKSRELLKKDVGKGTPSTATLNVVKQHFAKATNSDKVRDKLDDIDGFLKNLPAITECHNECDPSCGSPAYWDPNRTKMILCAGFDGKDPQDQAGTIMHEATHGVPTVKSEDLGYSSDRIINFLDETHAFKNTDSYTTLVRDLTGLTKFADPVPADVLSGFKKRKIGGVDVEEKDLVGKAEALAEKWCIWAYQDLQFLYGQIRKAIAGSATLSGPDATEVMASLHTHFALTDSTLKPKFSDQGAVAALRDRYHRFGIETFNQALGVKAVSGKNTAWGKSAPAIPGGKFVVPANLEIGDDFWTRSSDEARARLLIEGLVRASKDATAGKANAYAQFAFDRSKTPERL
jgi:outer membrane protein OmpA-like peptidoglycan-associated protein